MARLQEYHRNDALNNLSLENKIGVAVEDYLKAIGKCLKNTNYKTGQP